MNQEILKQAELQAALCSVLSNPCRLMILWSLSEGELSVGEIAEEVNSSLQNVSQHLRTLKDNNLVRGRREGQHVYYQIDEDSLLTRCVHETKEQCLEILQKKSANLMEVLNDYA